MIFSPETYLWFKSFHIIGVVVWFAGLFYLVRLFIYHVEVQNEKEEIRDLFNKQYALMEKRLANIITTPGMILAVIMASGLLYMQPIYLSQSWMQIKLLFVVFLLIYHFYCYKIMNELTNNQYNYSGQQLRALNELPTLLLVVVVMLVVFKNQFPTSAASWLIFGLFSLWLQVYSFMLNGEGIGNNLLNLYV